MTNDPLADFLIRIKNASAAGKPDVSVPFSKFKFEIASLLAKEGFLGSVERRGKKVKKTLDVTLKYREDETPEVVDVQRVSRLGKRVYMGVADIKPVRHGHGLLVLSTPKGILTDREARKQKVGGEALFKIW